MSDGAKDAERTKDTLKLSTNFSDLGAKCGQCGEELKCLGGHSAHPQNWYCDNDDCLSKKGQAALENSGGSVSYYTVEITCPHHNAPYTAECTDITDHLDMTCQEYNIFKEIWRTAAARQGRKKEGHSQLRAAEKIKFFADRNLQLIKFKEG